MEEDPENHDPLISSEDEDEGAKDDSSSRISATQTPGQSVLSSEEQDWRHKDLAEQCKDVLNALKNNGRRWDETTGNPGVQVLESYKKTSLAESRDPRDRQLPTALHHLAKETNEFSAASKDCREKLVQHLLEQGVNAFGKTKIPKGAKDDLVLAVAIRWDNHEFVDCVEQYLGERFSDLLHLQDGDLKNCFHHMQGYNTGGTQEKQHRDRECFRNWVSKLTPKAKPDTLATADALGNTPIHHFMHFQQCLYMPDEYIENFKSMVRRADKSMVKIGSLFNNDGESPILYSQNELRNAQKRSEERKRAAAERRGYGPANSTNELAKTASKTTPQPGPDTAASTDTQAIQKGRTPKGNTSRPREPLPNPEGEKVTAKEPIGKTDKAADALPGPFRKAPTFQDRDIKALPAKSQPTNKNTQKPQSQDQPPVSRRPNGKPHKGMAEKRKAYKEIHEFLKVHYLRSRSDLEARELIYGKAALDSVKNLYFDAKTEPDVKRVIELLKRMAMGDSKDSFSSTLAYVHLPTLRPNSLAKPPGTTASKSEKENPNMGRTELVGVFDELHRLGVKTILRLCVEDRNPPSHTDAAIERALQGRESVADGSGTGAERSILVETWDWRKPDMSTDVIAFAAPKVENVVLYWSGNQAVLQSWGSSDGIPRLYVTSRRLKKVIVNAAPGLETLERMEENLRRFEKEISTKTNNSVKVKIVRRLKGLQANMDADEKTADFAGEELASKQHAWVETMETFRGALYSLLQAPQPGFEYPEKVKIALIDDGVSLSNLEIYNNTVDVRGFSFCPRARESENPWHCSSAGHGTIMANMIVRVNPWVTLYVMKVHHGFLPDGGSSISIGSATKAIRAAVDLRVNIISMSWTIKHISKGDGEKETPEALEVKALGKAIDEAKAANILMFCSTSDDIAAVAENYLPYQRQPDYIFRIGAALPQGQRDSNSEDPEKINYYFPGNRVAGERSPRSTGPLRYHDGSSVSTALATGLASLVIYCARLAANYARSNNLREKNEFEKFAKIVQERRNMDLAFRNIKHQSWHDSKYLPVWMFFSPVVQRTTGAKDKLNWDGILALVTLLKHLIT